MRKGYFLILLLFLSGTSVCTAQYWFVFLNSNPDRIELSKEEAERLQAGHMANMDSMVKRGTLVGAGPFYDGGGILILNLPGAFTDYKTMLHALRDDPAIQADRFKVKGYKIRFIKGNICELSEPYEMATYSFISFKFGTEDASPRRSTIQKHRNFIRSNITPNEILTWIDLKNGGDSVLLLKSDFGETLDAFFKKDPTVQSGQVSYKIRKLWIAKGTFCE